jgi:integrase
MGPRPRNVAAAVDPPRPHPPDITPLSPTQQSRTLLQAARGDRLEALYVLAVSTGMRQGEILGLGWEDVDLGAGVVRVRRTLTLARGGPRLAKLKTPKSRRQIRFTTSAM